MSDVVEQLVNREYAFGFHSDIATDLAPKGLNEDVAEHPDLVRAYLGSVVPYRDNFFATLNSAVFSDGSFAFVPAGVRCPMELSTYFRINAAQTASSTRWRSRPTASRPIPARR